MRCQRWAILLSHFVFEVAVVDQSAFAQQRPQQPRPLGTIDNPSSQSEQTRSDSKPDLEGFGFAPTREGVQSFLRSFSDADKEVTLQRIKALRSPIYATRQEALVQLMNDPTLNPQLLIEAQKSADTDLKINLSQVLSINTPERTEAMITSALNLIAEREFSALAADILNMLDGRNLNQESTISLALAAFETTLLAEDVNSLKGAIESDTDIVRYLAAQGLIKLLGQTEALPLLRPLVDDPFDDLSFTVANLAADQRDRICLKGYARLLTSEKFHYRWQSIQNLQHLTGESFEYFAAGEDVEERNQAAKAWQDWIEKNGEHTDVNFDNVSPWQDTTPSSEHR